MHRKGEHLTDQEVEAIRKAHAAGRTPEQISADTGISLRAVKRRTAGMPGPARERKPLPPRHYTSAFEPR